MTIEELSKLEEVLPKVSAFVENMLSHKEYADYEALITEIEKFEKDVETVKQQSDIDAALELLTKAVELLKGVKEKYPYPAPDKAEDAPAEEQEEQSAEDEEIAQLKAENEELLNKIKELTEAYEALERELKFESRKKELLELKPDLDIESVKELLETAKDEDFEQMKKLIVTQSVDPEPYTPSASTDKNVIAQLKNYVLGGDS